MKDIRFICLEKLQACITACEQCIDACQTFADKCSTHDKQECAKQVGRCKNRLQHCITACHAVIEAANTFMTSSNNPEHIDALDRVTDASKACIKGCNKAIESCNTDFDSCNIDTLAVLKICSECAKACAHAIQVLNT